jgi:toxin CptA
VLFAPALVLAFVAGFALQRGGICIVIAVREAIEQGRWRRFLSFLECSAWAMAGLLIVNAMGWMALGAWPQQASIQMALLGGAVFGAGALVNGACAFGSAGRFAAGELSFLAFIPGFVAGAALATVTGGAVAMRPEPQALAPNAVVAGLALALTAFAIWRLWRAWRDAPTLTKTFARLRAPHWPAPLAMAVIAFANVALLMIVFAWPYTALLVDYALARGMDLAARSLIALVFLAGAIVGAWSAGRFKLRGASWGELGARLGGGALMGFGAALIPGGNDALVLLGLPLLQPAAFAAYAAMTAVIVAGFAARRAIAPKVVH